MASGSFYNYPTQSFGVYCEWTSTSDSANNQSTVVLKTYLSYYTINVSSSSKWETSINGKVENFTSPAIKVSSASAWTKKLLNTRTEVVKHNSDGTKQIVLSASYPFNGKYSGKPIGTITASKTVTLDNIKTKCTAPSTFTVTSDRLDADGHNQAFETKLTLEWKNARAGIGNTITGYQISYATNSDNATWKYANLQKITSTSNSGKITIDMSSKVARNNYVRFKIQTLGSAGSSYYSSVTTASYIKANGDTAHSMLRQPYTQCGKPTSVTASSNNFDSTVKIEWSGAKNGDSNTISSYYIQYATSSNNSTWGSWTGLTTVNSTAVNGSKSIDMSSKVSRGHYVKFRVRTQGSAGGSYYSGYTESTSIRRQPYTKCGKPQNFSVTDTKPTSTSEFKIKLDWSGASNGTANSISSYYIWYAVSTSESSGYGSWRGLASISSTAVQGSYSVDMSANVTRGYYVKFRIEVRGSAGSSYYSDYKETNVVRRNPYTHCTAPTTITLSSDKSGQPFENNITIAWSGASGGTNNGVASYLIRYSTSVDNATWSSYADLSTVTSTSASGSKVIAISDKQVTRGHYIKIAIKTIGKISGYDSGWTYSTTLQRNPYSACGKPTTVTVKSEADLKNIQHTDVFNNEITISWSGESAGSNNAIQRYYIEYCTSTNNSTWSAWSSLQSSNLTPVGTSTTTVDISTKVNRGDYAKFRIRTEGEAGSSYYSPYVETSPIRRNSIPTPPTFAIFDLEYSNDETIYVKWSGAEDTDSNLFNYELSASITINDVWENWQIVDSSISGIAYNLTSDNVIHQAIANNQQIKFRIRVQDTFGQYSSYVESDIVTRYDDSGVCIGINNGWIPCQIYIGENGKWVEYSLCAGVNGAWKQCGVE